MIRSSRRAASIALAAVLLAARAAHADPSAADVESAKLQYHDGKELRDKGDLAGALARFKAAFALVPTPITALEVGRTQIAMGHVIDGRETLLAIAKLPKKPDESEKAADARAEAEKLADESKAKLATVTVAVPGDAPAAVSIDGATIPPEASRAPRVVDPGHHVITVKQGNQNGRAEIDVAEGEQRSIAVTLVADAPPPPPPPLPHAAFKPNALLGSRS